MSRKCVTCGGILLTEHNLNAHKDTLTCVAVLKQRLAAAEEVMKAAASLPGEMWLVGQLALAEFLSGEGGEHLQYVLNEHNQYEAAKGGRDE